MKRAKSIETTWYFCSFSWADRSIKPVTVLHHTPKRVVFRGKKKALHRKRVGFFGEYHPTYEQASQAWIAHCEKKIAAAQAAVECLRGELEQAKDFIEKHRPAGNEMHSRTVEMCGERYTVTVGESYASKDGTMTATVNTIVESQHGPLVQVNQTLTAAFPTFVELFDVPSKRGDSP